MAGFSFYIPTRVLFGPGMLNELATVKLPGRKALIVTTAGKSVKKYGYLDRVISLLKQYGGRIFEKVLGEHGIEEFNGPQGRILYVLWEQEGISIQELSQKSGLANATLTSMLDRMERRQLVKRLPAPGDRRKTLIALTPKARVLEQKYRAVSERMNELIYQGFSAEEAAQLEAYLERVLDNVRRTEMQQNNLKK